MLFKKLQINGVTEESEPQKQVCFSKRTEMTGPKTTLKLEHQHVISDAESSELHEKRRNGRNDNEGTLRIGGP